MQSRKNKICFVNSDTYPVLSGTASADYVGGESVQHTLLARAFARAGYEASVVVGDFGQRQGESIDGIRVWKTFRQSAGLPIVRFLHPRMTKVMKALRLADADIYYQSCASSVTGLTAFFCKRYRRNFVFRAAHDTDLMPNHELIPFQRDKRIYQYGLKAADLISVQSKYQKDLLWENYALEGRVTNMIVEPPDGEIKSKRYDVLWVNNLRGFKRPALLLELAKRLPKLNFAMVGGPCKGEESLFDSITREARTLPNLEMTGPVPYSKVNDYFLKSKIFVNTSESEGFPNSFLQAWIRGLPVISFFDPDDVIQQFRLGASVDTMEQMTIKLSEVASDSQKREATGSRARLFVEKRFSPEPIVDAYVSAFDLFENKQEHLI